VPQFFLLSLHITFGVLARCDFAGHPFGHSDPGALQRSNFVGIVGQQARLLNTERLQDFGWQLEFAVVGLEPESLIGFDRVQSAVLERIGLKLRHQPDAAPFLLLVDQNPGALLRDHRQRHFQLLPAVAAQGSEHVSGQTLGVNPHQRRTRKIVAHHEGHGFFLLAGSVPASGCKTVNTELPPAGRKVGRSNLLHLRFTHTKIISLR